LYLREKTGKGQLVQNTMLDADLTSLDNQVTNNLVAGFEQQLAGSEHPNIVPYGTIFTTSDQKQLILAIGDDRQFRNLCQVLGEPGIADDVLFSKNCARVKNRVVLNEKLKMLIAGFTREFVLAELEKRFVPAGAVKSVSEALSGDAAKALQLSSAENGKALLGLKTVAFRLQKTGNNDLVPPPHYAQHTREVLQAFAGLEEEALEKLLAEGVIQ
jgi:crotonobetainyl-CoA:carnitine CoA-transferase CaiB-like acyl-CoA transferase